MTDFDSKIADLNRQWEHTLAQKHGLEEQVRQLEKTLLKLEGAFEICAALQREQQAKEFSDAQEEKNQKEVPKDADATAHEKKEEEDA